MKITKDDRYVWKIIDPMEAEVLFDIFPIYRLYEDDSESLVEFISDITSDGVYGIGVGFLPEETLELEYLGKGVYIKK
jgi:hypothetical protein